MMSESTMKRTAAFEEQPESSAKKSRYQDDEWDEGDENQNQEPKPSVDRRKAVEANPDMIVHFQHSTKSEREKKRLERQKRIEEQLKRVKTEKEESS
jgi:hypothetical protein